MTVETTGGRVARLMDTLAVESDTLLVEPEATIVPDGPGSDSGAGRALANLAGQQAQLGSLAQRVKVGERIGAGGMGEVLAAEQVSVGRTVAVKRLRQESSDAGVTALLREGWVTGALEHPNVMPLYDLGLDESGRPLLVLKRIEGVHWGDLIADPVQVRKRFGVDPLEWHVQILLQLCNALRYAHEKGIIHRDVKPENVMIGEFGEVYLLDWGIALALHSDGTGRLPHSRNTRGMAGTPVYMAPEMLDAEAELTVRTDIYLLGASLYHVISGSPPHGCDSLEGFIKSVVRSDPQLPEGTPEELARACRKAMHPQPNERYADAEELRSDLQDFLSHRGSRRVTQEAYERLDALESALVDVTGEHEERLELYEQLSACRFGFTHATSVWPDNKDAKAGLQRAVGLMLEYELGHGEPAGAATLLAELDASQAERYKKRVEDALVAARADEAEFQRLRAYRTERDTRTGRNTRRFLFLVAGLSWAAGPFIAQYLPQRGNTYAAFIVAPIVYFAMMAALAIWARDSVGKSHMNRTLVAVLLLTLVVEALLTIAGWMLGIEVAATQTMHFIPWLMVSGCVAVMFAPRLWFVPVGYAIGLLVAAWDPSLRFFAMAACHLVTTAGMAGWSPVAESDRARARTPGDPDAA